MKKKSRLQATILTFKGTSPKESSLLRSASLNHFSSSKRMLLKVTDLKEAPDLHHLWLWLNLKPFRFFYNNITSPISSGRFPPPSPPLRLQGPLHRAGSTRTPCPLCPMTRGRPAGRAPRQVSTALEISNRLPRWCISCPTLRHINEIKLTTFTSLICTVAPLSGF